MIKIHYYMIDPVIKFKQTHIPPSVKGFLSQNRNLHIIHADGGVESESYASPLFFWKRSGQNFIKLFFFLGEKNLIKLIPCMERDKNKYYFSKSSHGQFPCLFWLDLENNKWVSRPCLPNLRPLFPKFTKQLSLWLNPKLH